MSHVHGKGVPSCSWQQPPSVATATEWQDDDEFVADPDDLKMPESPDHRRVIDAIGIIASTLLEPTLTVYRDMNWYPPGGGNAVAPDLMVRATDAPVVRDLTNLAEELDFDSVCTLDRIVVPEASDRQELQYPSA